MDDERGTLGGPQFAIGLGALGSTERRDDPVHQQLASQPGQVDHAAIAEEFAQVFAHITDRWAVRCTDVDEHHSGAGLRFHVDKANA